jgi:nucleotide-binding universal stress UspA family protein
VQPSDSGVTGENRFKNILIPLDGSETAEIVLSTAKGLGKALGAHLTLVRVVDIAGVTRSIIPTSNDGGIVTQEIQDIIDETIASELKEAADYLDTIAAQCQAEGIANSTQVRQGVAGEELLEAIEEEHIDVATIATHARSGIKRTIFGSVADQLVRESGKPVLVIKANK